MHTQRHPFVMDDTSIHVTIPVDRLTDRVFAAAAGLLKLAATTEQSAPGGHQRGPTSVLVVVGVKPETPEITRPDQWYEASLPDPGADDDGLRRTIWYRGQRRYVAEGWVWPTGATSVSWRLVFLGTWLATDVVFAVPPAETPASETLRGPTLGELADLPADPEPDGCE
jgi:hypothetical protein